MNSQSLQDISSTEDGVNNGEQGYISSSKDAFSISAVIGFSNRRIYRLLATTKTNNSDSIKESYFKLYETKIKEFTNEENLSVLVWDISLLLIWDQCLFNLLVSLLINRKLWSFCQNRSGPKVDLSRAKRNTSRANSPLLFRSREVHFWTRFWSSKEESCHLKTEENNAMITKKEMETKASAQIVSFLIIE